MMKRIRNVLIPLFSLAVCVIVLAKWTKGFTAFTIYSYTLEKAHPLSEIFPDLELINQDGKLFNVRNSDTYTLINFVYLDCPDVCHKVNNELEGIYHKMDHSLIPSRLKFLTVSFDLKEDNVKKIAQYRSLFGKNIGGWTFALPYKTTEKDFYAFLQQIGIWAYRIPDTGMINHSSYMLLVAPNGEIIKVFDPVRESDHTIIAQIDQCLGKEELASVL